MTAGIEIDVEVLLPRFGLSSFRPGQREVISAVMAGEDCLCIMPTGGGKSLCYQLPSIAREGLTLVISPLIALMKDQVDTLVQRGMRATYINSTLDASEQQIRLNDMARGQYDLVYVVPERFRSSRFLDALRRSELQLLAIDEAHCISEWGHDFRPDYARLGQYRQQIGSPTTIALTATATRLVQDDIVELLELDSPRTLITGFGRPNLRYQVQRPPSYEAKDESLMAFLREHPGTGIVYTSARKRCEEVAEKITRQTRRPALAYHAGLAPDDRRQAQDRFMQGEVDIMVATTAFGMGIDKADVRFVVHYNLPGTVEGYYQESGRAGRDGKPATCLLLYNYSDRRVQEFFIESAYPSQEVVEQVYEYLCALDDDPIELTQQEIKEALELAISSDGVGQCEQLLDKAGAIERLESSQNMAVARISSDLPTLVDLLPRQAKTRRKVLQAVEKIIGRRRHEMVYFHRQELAERTELDGAAVSRTLAELRALEAFDYVPPFRGRAIHVLRRDVPFDALDLDFEFLERRKAHEYEKLRWMCRFAESGACRQQEILHYFGESSDQGCGQCDNCQTAGGPPAEIRSVESSEDPVFQAVLKVLSGVARAQQRFGRQLIAQMLCGSNAETVARYRLDRLSTFGLLKNLTQGETIHLIDGLITARCLRQVEVEPGRPILQLTEKGEAIMRQRAELDSGLLLPSQLFDKIRGRKALKPGGIATDPSTDDSRPDPDLLATLKRWRRDQAEAKGVPPYRVLSNATLEDLVRTRPSSLERLLDVKGIGTSKLRSYGNAILDLVADRSDADKHPAVSVMDNSGRALDAVDARRWESSANPASPAESTRDGDPDLDSQPSYYWTWRVLSQGFTLVECCRIRSLTTEVVLDHVLRAAEEGWSVSEASIFEPEQIEALEGVIGKQKPTQIRPLLERLPAEISYQHVQMFVKCRFQNRLRD